MDQLNLDDFEKAVLATLKCSKASDNLVYNMAYFIPCAVMTVLGQIYNPGGPWVFVALLTYALMHMWMLRRQARSHVALKSLVLKMESHIEGDANTGMNNDH